MSKNPHGRLADGSMTDPLEQVTRPLDSSNGEMPLGHQTPVPRYRDEPTRTRGKFGIRPRSDREVSP